MTDKLFNDKEVQEITQKAAKIIKSLVSSTISKIAKGNVYSQYEITEKDTKTDKTVNKKVSLKSDAIDFTTQDLLIATFVKENPELVGLNKASAFAFHHQVTRGIHHSDFNKELNNFLVNSAQQLKKQNPQAKVKAPETNECGAQNYTKIIELSKFKAIADVARAV